MALADDLPWNLVGHAKADKGKPDYVLTSNFLT
jgi:hypothetical protein